MRSDGVNFPVLLSLGGAEASLGSAMKDGWSSVIYDSSKIDWLILTFVVEPWVAMVAASSFLSLAVLSINGKIVFRWNKEEIEY